MAAFCRKPLRRLAEISRRQSAESWWRRNQCSARRSRTRHGVRGQSGTAAPKQSEGGSGDGAFGRAMMMEQSTRLVRAKAVSRCASHRIPRHAGAMAGRNSQTGVPSGAEYAAPPAVPKSDEGETGLACRAVVGRRLGIGWHGWLCAFAAKSVCHSARH